MECICCSKIFYNESNRYLKWILRNKDKSLITIDWITLLLQFTFIVNTSFGYICGFVSNHFVIILILC